MQGAFEINLLSDYNLPRRNRIEVCMQPEPNMDLAHLGHLELLTPKPEESLRFFVNVMGMTESGGKGNRFTCADTTTMSAIR